jgi:hypothetical protein
MSQGRTSVIRAFGTVWMIFAASASTVCAQKICRPPQNFTKSDALVRGGYVGGDGKVHFTFSIEPGADSKQEQAFREAVKIWNDQSDVTWMVLEPGDRGAATDIKFGAGPIEYIDDDPKKGEKFYCGKHDPNDSSIRYHPTKMSFAGEKPDLAVKIYVHEVGHLLGLAHVENGGLMDDTSYRHLGDCEKAAQIVKPLLPKDARAALHCAFTVHYMHRPPALPGRD